MELAVVENLELPYNFGRANLNDTIKLTDVEIAPIFAQESLNLWLLYAVRVAANFMFK